MEIWKKIQGHPFYEASSNGRIRSIDRKVIRGGREMSVRGRILSPGIGKKGHRYVNLQMNGSIKTEYIHRLIAISFIGEQPHDKPIVAHINGDPSDNRPSNLRWSTHLENSNDSIIHGTSGRPGGEDHAKAKLDKSKIESMRDMHSSGMSMRSIGRTLGIHHCTVSNALSGKSYR